MRRTTAIFGLAVIVVTTASRAQQPAAVQLPTFRQFTTQTSVLVPDRGTALIGGVGGSAATSRAVGPAVLSPMQSSGSSIGAGSVSIHAQVHDMAELDRQVLAAAGGDGTPATPSIAGNSVLRGAAPPAGSVADAEQARRAELAARDAEASRYAELALEAAAQGKANVAKLYRQMAVRRASPAMRDALIAQFRKLDEPTPRVAERE